MSLFSWLIDHFLVPFRKISTSGRLQLFIRFVLIFPAVKAKRETQLIVTKEEPHQHRKLMPVALFSCLRVPPI